MTEIRGVDGVLPTAVGFGAPVLRPAENADGGVAVEDRVEISELARSLSADQDGSEINGMARIAEIRAAIRGGTYLTMEKLSMALDRALENL